MCLFVCLVGCVCVSLRVFGSLAVRLFVCFVSLFVCLFACLFIWLVVCAFACVVCCARVCMVVCLVNNLVHSFFISVRNLCACLFGCFCARVCLSARSRAYVLLCLLGRYLFMCLCGCVGV